MRYRSRGRNAACIRLLLALVLILSALIFFNWQFKPVIESVTVNEAKMESVNIINHVVLTEINHNPASYQNLILVNRDAAGRVLSVTTDVAKMNRLKAQVISSVQQSLNGNTDSTVQVPLGTLLGSNLLHGIGPNIPMRLTLSGNISAEFQSTFESAGINQTRHRITLNVGASVYSFLPGFDTTTEVTTSVLIAETVIVGTVPTVVMGK
jgi:sporulation protein YunB